MTASVFFEVFLLVVLLLLLIYESHLQPFAGEETASGDWSSKTGSM